MMVVVVVVVVVVVDTMNCAGCFFRKL